MNAAKASYSYTLSPTGNRTGAVESSGRTLNWTYDGIYRLTNETISLDPHSVNGSVGYGLDPVGNRQSQTSSIPGIGTGNFTFDPDDRLNTETYDANGNTLTTGGKTFAYDFENRLKSMTDGTVAVTLAYDADGNRVAKTVNGVTTRYLVDDLNPTGYAQVVEEVTAGAVTRQYTYGLQRISQTQQIANAWTPSFYGYDGESVGGSVRLLTDLTGTVTDTYDFDGFGNEVNTTGSTPNVYLYRGEQFDPDLSLYYLRARFYDPSTGRFVSTDPQAADPTDPTTLHRYLYASADPANRVDPSGRAGFLMFTIQSGGYVAFSPGPLAQVKVSLPVPACQWGNAGGGSGGGGLGTSGGRDVPLDAAGNPGGGGGFSACNQCKVKVRCRRLSGFGAILGQFDHCYIVTNKGLFNGTITAGPTNPDGTGCVHVWELPVDPAPDNSVNDQTVFDAWVPCGNIKCLSDVGDFFNRKCFPYVPIYRKYHGLPWGLTGQNCNSFVYYAMKWCGMPVSLPMRAIGGSGQ